MILYSSHKAVKNPRLHLGKASMQNSSTNSAILDFWLRSTTKITTLTYQQLESRKINVSRKLGLFREFTISGNLRERHFSRSFVGATCGEHHLWRRNEEWTFREVSQKQFIANISFRDGTRNELFEKDNFRWNVHTFSKNFSSVQLNSTFGSFWLNSE